jgi:hypothetical protein
MLPVPFPGGLLTVVGVGLATGGGRGVTFPFWLVEGDSVDFFAGEDIFGPVRVGGGAPYIPPPPTAPPPPDFSIAQVRQKYEIIIRSKEE